MNLVDRYVASIRRNLPGDRAEDIAAELRDLLASRIEDREAALDRPLNGDETKAVLRDFGHPLVVAARYRKQQWLIGPDVFPFYLSVLRIVLAILALVFVVVAAVNLLFHGDHLLRALAGALGGLWMSALINVANVTIVFVILERMGFPADHLRKWDPGQLADVKDKQPGPWESAIEVALGIAFLLWWTGLVHLPFGAGGPSFRIEPAPIFTQLYWPILTLVAARLVHSLIQGLRPRWWRLRMLVGAATAVGGIALLALIYRAGRWAIVVPNGMPADKAAELQNSLNLSLSIAIVVIAIVWSVQCLLGFYRLWRRGRFQPIPA
ncbi:MAG: hypothetical protein JWO81_200 [Alphaproteobacteria bacterium]|nr:hypothetical protein [Alphaproteobacteria bacterium]